MKEERNIIKMDERSNISLPSDIGVTAMTEQEIRELFGVIAPTVRAGIKALCKSGVFCIYDIKRIIRISDKYRAEVYNLGLQPRNDSRPRFPCRIVRGGESPQGIIREDYTRTKRKNDGVRAAIYGLHPRKTLAGMMIYQHTNISACKPISMMIYITGAISLFRGKRSNHFHLQRRNKHGAFRRLQGQAATPLGEQSPPSYFG